METAILAEEDAARLYRSIRRIRRVDEEIVRLYPTDAIKSPVHLSIGQEAVSVGVVDALRPSDILFGTYRSHALYLARSTDLRAFMAELWGKAAGCAGGKGGSMHMADIDAGVMGTSAIVGTTIPQAVGYALAEKMRGRDTVVAVFFGEGAVDEGVFHESLNFAALRRLPVLFVCENNLYAIYSHMRDRLAGSDLIKRATAYGVMAERVETGKVTDIRACATAAAARLREGNGPMFLECMTYRWRDHVGPDEDRWVGYRANEEIDQWVAKDEMYRMGTLLPDRLRAAIDAQIEEEIASAIAFAESSPFPALEELTRYVTHG